MAVEATRGGDRGHNGAHRLARRGVSRRCLDGHDPLPPQGTHLLPGKLLRVHEGDYKRKKENPPPPSTRISGSGHTGKIHELHTLIRMQESSPPKVPKVLLTSGGFFAGCSSPIQRLADCLTASHACGADNVFLVGENPTCLVLALGIRGSVALRLRPCMAWVPPLPTRNLRRAMPWRPGGYYAFV